MNHCPHCGRAILLPDIVRANLRKVGEHTFLKAPCCGKPLRVEVYPSYEISKHITENPLDSFGAKYET